MLTIFCGDNTVASREAFGFAKKKLESGGSFVSEIEPASILDIAISGGSNAWDLFAGKPVYTTNFLVKTLKRKLARNAKEKIRELSKDPNIEILDWEDSSAYDLGLTGKEFSFVKDSKLASSTFTLLPMLKPKNASKFLTELQELSKSQPIEVTVSMLIRHVKLMLFAKKGILSKDSPFMVRAAANAGANFTQSSLLELYKRLLKSDINTKTGRGTTLSIKEQIETIIAFAL